MQFWPPDDEHMSSKHVEAWNKLIVKQKFCASSWLITEINILRCTVSKTSKFKKNLLTCLTDTRKRTHMALSKQWFIERIWKFESPTTFGRSLQHRSQSQLWDRWYDEWKNWFMELCKLYFIINRSGSNSKLCNNFYLNSPMSNYTKISPTVRRRN